MPSGLSSTIQPCTGSPRRLRRPSVVLLVLRGAEVARDFRLLQDFIDARRRVEGRIALELQARNEPQTKHPAELALEEGRRPLQCGEHPAFVAAAERNDEGRRVAQVGADPHLRHRERAAVQVGIAQIAATEQLGQGMPQFLADAQLTNGWLLLSRHRSEEHTSELQSLMRHSYAVFCLKKKKKER